MKDIREQIEKEKNAQLRSIPAQRLIEKLSLLKNRVNEAKKRWFWELLQNASDYNESVNVRLTIDDKKVVFSHDGAPFSVRDALNLISPDSNKLEDTLHKDNIGKFGTGLVSTHILSSLLEIDGLFTDDENQLYKFSIQLDRSCFLCKADLIEQITNAEETFKNSFKKVSLPTASLNTFSYTLGKSLPGLAPLKSSDIDLGYLIDVLPYTLCFMPKIKTVVIEDNRKEHTFRNYKISRHQVTSQEISFNVELDSNSSIYTFAYFKNGDVASAFRYDGNTIFPYPTGMSRLFCGLPLIGTEDVGIPVILNSLKFTPTTEREGVELEPTYNEENRKQFINSIDLYSQMLAYVAKKKMRNAFHIARIGRKYNGTQASNTQFVKIYLPKYKQSLLDNAVVVNDLEQFVSLANLKLPFKESKLDLDLYKVCSYINVGLLPRQQDYQAWFDVIDFTIFTNLQYTYTDLSKQIEEKANIYSFGKKSEEVLSWLLNCASYFLKNDKDLFLKYKLLPNQSGQLCKVDGALYVDKDLPEELKAIYDSLFEIKKQKIGDKLLMRDFNKLDILKSEFTLRMLANEIDNELSLKYSEKKGDVSDIRMTINQLYNWISKATISKEDLASYFHWYYPKRATLIVDMLSEVQREQALTIAQSGRMEQLAALAVSDISDDEFKLIVANINKLPGMLNMLMQQVDDKTYADSYGGNLGEEIVYKDLINKFPVDKGFRVIWASKDRNEPCFDFEITKNGKTFMYCDAKTTSRGISNADSIPFFLRKSQWNFLNDLDDSIPYIVARVFMSDGQKIRYIRITETNKTN